MICVDPHSEFVIDAIAGIDHPVTVASIRRVIENCQRSVSVRCAAWGLWGKIAEQLRKIVNGSISVPVQCEPSIVPLRIGPAYAVKRPVSMNVKIHSGNFAGQVEAFFKGINDDRRSVIAAVIGGIIAGGASALRVHAVVSCESGVVITERGIWATTCVVCAGAVTADTAAAVGIRATCSSAADAGATCIVRQAHETVATGALIARRAGGKAAVHRVVNSL
jgi:hypothetical protein